MPELHNPENPVLEVKDGSIEFKNVNFAFDRSKKVLSNINLTIEPGDIVGIVGTTGSGKSTLLKAIVDNEMLTEGIGEDKFNIYKEGSPRVGFLKQIDFEDDQITMLDEILKVYKEQLEIEAKLEKLVEKMQIDSNEELVVKGGIVEGSVLGADQLSSFGELPSKNALVASVLGTFLAPISSLAFVLDQIRMQKDGSAPAAEAEA